MWVLSCVPPNLRTCVQREVIGDNMIVCEVVARCNADVKLYLKSKKSLAGGGGRSKDRRRSSAGEKLRSRLGSGGASKRDSSSTVQGGVMMVGTPSAVASGDAGGAVGPDAARLPPAPTDDAELEKEFLAVIALMGNSAEVQQTLLQMPRDKKWRLVCDHRNRQSTSRTASGYCLQLTKYREQRRKLKASRGDEPSPIHQLLLDLEVSLRTEPISWVREFVDPPNCGVDALVELLAQVGDERREEGLEVLTVRW